LALISYLEFPIGQILFSGVCFFLQFCNKYDICNEQRLISDCHTGKISAMARLQKLLPIYNIPSESALN
jgi:hypothetical protein